MTATPLAVCVCVRFIAHAKRPKDVSHVVWPPRVCARPSIKREDNSGPASRTHSSLLAAVWIPLAASRLLCRASSRLSSPDPSVCSYCLTLFMLNFPFGFLAAASSCEIVFFIYHIRLFVCFCV